jgi:hypothetical protein
LQQDEFDEVAHRETWAGRCTRMYAALSSAMRRGGGSGEAALRRTSKVPMLERWYWPKKQARARASQ